MPTIEVNHELYEITLPTTAWGLKKLVGMPKDAWIIQKRGVQTWDFWNTNKRFTAEVERNGDALIHNGDRFLIISKQDWWQMFELDTLSHVLPVKSIVPCTVCGYRNTEWEHGCRDRAAVLSLAERRGYPEVYGPGSQRGSGKSHWQGLIRTVEAPMVAALARRLLRDDA